MKALAVKVSARKWARLRLNERANQIETSGPGATFYVSGMSDASVDVAARWASAHGTLYPTRLAALGDD